MAKSASSPMISARRVVVTSFLVNISDVILNLIVAFLSGSIIMVTEALQGAADLLTTGLLLIGVQKSSRKPDRLFRFGYGRELYFWVLMAGVSTFILTATISFSLGLNRFLNPHPLENVHLAIAMLTFATFSNTYSLSLSYRRIGAKSSGTNLMRKILKTHLIESKATFILDLMGSSAAFLGLVSLGLFLLTGNARFDGVGAMLIGFFTGCLAILLIREVKDLIVGRSADPAVERQIRKLATSIPEVKGVLDLRTMHMGSEKLLVNMEVHLEPKLTTKEIELITDNIKLKIENEIPIVKHIQVEIETPTR